MNFINQNSDAFSIRLMLIVWGIAALIATSACRPIDETASAPLPAIPPPATQTPATAPAASPSPALKKKSAVRLPRLEAELKKAVTARLNSWKKSIETRDLEKHLQHYADQVDAYYLTANVNRDFISAERRRAFEQFKTFDLEIINIDVNLDASDAATVTFDKSWDFKNGERFSNGLVRQEIQMRKIEKQWLIVSEKDLEIYRYQNQ